MRRAVLRQPGDGRFVIGVQERADAVRRARPCMKAGRIVDFDLGAFHFAECARGLPLARQHDFGKR
ncbi:MAG: hypothetical protein K5863_08010 [Nitratireductor sp.]|uniref:hypothetical protein n=1 Tax=Nitratireductor sp. TaxID=1872084 RepID=UPI00260E8DAF|nr:hypothetical protein [Nitratireductor sp.]MCV0350009.1 hypothetical protein [Nitratireductor sp.]